MRETKQLVPLLCHQGLHRFICIEEARPGHACDGVRECRLRFAAVERIVSIPKRFPFRKIFLFDGPYLKFAVQRPPRLQKEPLQSRLNLKGEFIVARQGIDALLAGEDHVYAASIKTTWRVCWPTWNSEGRNALKNGKAEFVIVAGAFAATNISPG
jgi:hypothetical protein